MISPNFRLRNPLYVGGGSHGAVYRAFDGSVVKVPHNNFGVAPSRNLALIEREAEIAQRLFDSGISVPKPFGMLSFILDRDGVEVNARGFFMRFVPGLDVDFEILAPSLYQRVREKKRVELDKARQLGFIPSDTDCIYSPRQDRVYLVDFAKWTAGS